MASSILSSLFSKSVVSFTNETSGLPCLTDAKTADVEIMSESDNSDAPLSNEQVSESSVSTGLLASDIKTAKIIKPTRIRITLLTNNISLVENVLALFADVTATISVTSKSIIANSMAIAGLEIEQVPDMLSATKLMLTLEQVQVTQSSSFNPAQSADQSTYGISVDSPALVGPTLGGVGGAIGSLISSAGDSVVSLYDRFAGNIGL